MALVKVSIYINEETLTVKEYEYDKVVLEVVTKPGQPDKVNRNLYGTNLLMRQADGLTLYYMYNGHADVTALIDTNGVIRATYYYDAFGNIDDEKYFTASGSPTLTPINNSIMYAGYQYDRETELYYLNARMYDPKIARFLQEDTYRGNPNDPLTLNLYAYTANNPLKYYDPTGHYFTMIDTFMGEKTYRQKVYEYDLETSDLVYRNRNIYIPTELLDRARLADGSSVYATRPYYTAEGKFLTYDTAIYSDIVYDYYERYILDETGYIIAPAYTLFLTWVEDSYDGKPFRFTEVVEDFTLGVGTSLFHGGLSTGSLALTGTAYLGEGATYLLSGGMTTTNWGRDAWRDTQATVKRTDEWINDFALNNLVRNPKVYETGRISGDIGQSLYGIYKIAQTVSSLPNSVRNIRNLNGGLHTFRDPYTGLPIREIPTDFGKVNIPFIPRNPVQQNYWNAITNNQGTFGNIKWSSGTVSDAARQLDSGVTQVTVKNRSQAEELFLGKYQGAGYRNTSGMSATEAKNFFGNKAGTYHWDDALDLLGRVTGHGSGNMHGELPHLQIHTWEGNIIRVFYLN
ncbi:UNVERIFIED_CONTAM: RHS repeat-associated protein [Acetivibrio alkalicellulosi]